MGRFNDHITSLIAARVKPPWADAARFRLGMASATSGAGSTAGLDGDLAELGEAILAAEHPAGLDDELSRTVSASEVALANMSAAAAASSDPRFLVELALLTRAEVLAGSGAALWPGRPNGRDLLESI